MRLRRSGLAQISDISQSSSPASVIRKPEKPLYEQIVFLVRNMEVLTDPQMAYVRTLPKDKVLELVDIYNRIMQNVNEAFS
jgi:hypothetical protein